MGRYRVGIVGCGNMGAWYARGFQALDCQVAACADPAQERAEALAAQTGAQAFPDYRAMLEAGGLDIVVVATWPSSHREITVAAAEAGVRGIICEKPIAITLAEADEMIEVCERRGVVLTVGHQHRLSPWAREGRRLIEEGAVGKVELIWGHCSLDLMNNGTHVIDTIHALNGDEPLEWVFGQIDYSSKIFGQRNHPDLYAEDAAVGRMHYANGVDAVIDLGVRARQDFAFKVIGSDGVIYLSPAEFRYVGKETAGWVKPQLAAGRGGREKIEDLLRAMETGQAPETSARRARAALEVIVGIFHSVAERRVVEAPVTASELSLKVLVEAS